MDFNDIFSDMFGGVNSYERVLTDDEYKKYKGRTPYILYKLKSGKYALCVGDSTLEIFDDIYLAKKNYVLVAKKWLGGV